VESRCGAVVSSRRRRSWEVGQREVEERPGKYLSNADYKKSLDFFGHLYTLSLSSCASLELRVSLFWLD
jgi:hypothetical protein